MPAHHGFTLSSIRQFLQKLLLCGIVLLVFFLLVSWALYARYLKPAVDDPLIYHEPFLNLPISLPKAALVLSSPRIAPFLDQKSITSRWGKLALSWEAEEERLHLYCSPCTLPLPAEITTASTALDEFHLYTQKTSSDQLQGSFWLRTDAFQLPFNWSALYEKGALSQVELMGDQLEIDTIYRFTGHLLNLSFPNQIQGNVSFKAQVALPERELTLQQLQINQFSVSGLDLGLTQSKGCGVPSKTLTVTMDAWLPRAVMAAEDQRFLQHPGYDAYEIKAALHTSLRPPIKLRGASTITQQVARLVYTGTDRSLQRKLTELLYAVGLEKAMSKEEIMALYIQNAPWGEDEKGNLLCGAQAASRYFFNLDWQQLQPAQAVWMASLLHAPARESRRWKKTGKINIKRAHWIAENLAHLFALTPKERELLIKQLNENFAPAAPQ